MGMESINTSVTPFGLATSIRSYSLLAASLKYFCTLLYTMKAFLFFQILLYQKVFYMFY